MSTTYKQGNYRGQHILKVNPNITVDASDEHDCVDVFLRNVSNVEYRRGYIVISTVDANGAVTRLYIHHNLPTEDPS